MKEEGKKREAKVRVNANKVKTVVITAMFLLSIFSVFASFPNIQGAPVVSHWFRGDVNVNGAPAPDGTVVSAKIDGVEYASNTTISGKYGYDGSFYVPGDDPDTPGKEGGVNGDNITFWVEGIYACCFSFSSGGHSDLDLEVTGVTPKPTITDWYNNKTGNNATDVTINESECVYFNATADHVIDTWRWFVNDTDQSHNSDSFTYCDWTVNGTYTVKVDATNATNGTSSPITWTVTVNDITAPAKVTGLTNDTPTATTVNLDWDASQATDFAKYSVYKNGAWLGNTTNDYYNVTGLEASTSYYFNVSAWDDNDNEGERSEGVTIMTTTHPAPTITGWNNITGDLSSVTVNETEAILFNATADQAIDYWSWYNDSELAQNGSSNEFTTSWDTNGTYNVKVNATNDNGTSNTVEWTVTVNDITAPVQVTGLTNGTPSTNAVDLWWNANEEDDLVGYKVYKDGSLLESVPKARTYCNVTGLSASTTYEFNVSAYDDNALEGENATVIVTTTAAPITGDIIINEIMYKPAGYDTHYEWVELYNNDTKEIDVSGWVLNGTIGGSDTILGGTMDTGEYIILAKNVTAFQERYPDVTCQIIKGNWSALANTETINLFDSTPTLNDTVTYEDIASENYTIELNATGGWEESLVDGGTPGEVNSVLGAEFEIPIYPGWNLISIPVEVENTSINAIFSGAHDGDKVYAYDTGTWAIATYYSALPGWYSTTSLTTIEPNKGYWYNAIEAYNITGTGTVPATSSVPIVSGWNLIGYTRLTPIALDDVITGSDGDKIYAYDSGTWGIATYYSALPGWYSTTGLTTMDANKGYWYSASTPFTWEY